MTIVGAGNFSSVAVTIGDTESNEADNSLVIGIIVFTVALIIFLGVVAVLIITCAIWWVCNINTSYMQMNNTYIYCTSIHFSCKIYVTVYDTLHSDIAIINSYLPLGHKKRNMQKGTWKKTIFMMLYRTLKHHHFLSLGCFSKMLLIVLHFQSI